MTGSVVNAGLLGANALSVIASVTSGNPFLEYIQNGASVAAVMGIFLWREMKRAERYERLYDEERKNALMRKISVPAVSSSARRMKNFWTTGTSSNCKVFLTSSLYLIINLNKGNYGFTSNI